MQIQNLQLKNRYFLAPLAGVSNLPFRLINKEHGCALVYTEMVSAQGLIRDGKKTKALMISDEREAPVSYQIFGSDKRALSYAAKRCEEYGADIIDLNMGCPVRKVIKNGAGCALLNEPEKVQEIFKSLRKSISVPFTIKLRLGMAKNDSDSFLEIAKIAQGEGVDAICLHPRTKNQQFKGEIDLDALKLLKQSVSIPIIGSGNLFTVKDVHKMFVESNCDAVMIARGALGNPFIFEDIIETLKDDPYRKECDPVEKDPADMKSRIKDAILKHVEYFLEFYTEDMCHREMKKHMIWYTKGLTGSSSFRKRVVVTRDLKEMLELVTEFCE
ncbi:tRNA dihydrouridine synthase DusB [Thermodesulfobacteriota bacterium]